MDTRRIRLTVQYDGEPYLGWQAQTQGPTVQQTLEAALGRMLGQPVRVQAAGRTDTGVHAMAMPVQFETAHPIPAEKIPIAASSFLPPSISILAAADAPAGFDVRRSAIMRWYRYQIRTSRLPLPLGPRAWKVHRPLDLEAVQTGLKILQGEHDFEGFRAAQCQATRTVLTLRQASLTRQGELLGIDFKCRSFLHHQVRFMVGTLVAMGQGQIDPGRLRLILERGQRPQLIQCAPPCGLALMAVGYDEHEAQQILQAAPPLPSF